MIRYALIAVLCASLVAAGALWWGKAQRDRARAAEAALAVQRNTSRVLATSVIREAEAAMEWRELYASIEGLPETFGCGDPVDRALGVGLQRRRASDPR